MLGHPSLIHTIDKSKKVLGQQIHFFVLRPFYFLNLLIQLYFFLYS